LRDLESWRWGSKEWANSQLRFAIGELKDASEKSEFQWKNSMLMVLIVKERLLEYGFTWQARVLEHWIHKYRAVLKKHGVRSA
jgi:hypothetical protein